MNEVVTRRAFNTAVENLFAAWATPEQLKKWWGPDGFTNTFETFEFRSGGNWRFTMHGPDGKDYWNESVFEEIEINRRIVFFHISEPCFRAEVSFEENKDGTSGLSWKMIFQDEKVYRALKDFVALKNEENLDRLEAELFNVKQPHA